MNKKILMWGVPILALALVSAIAYYSFFSATFTVTPAINVVGAGTFTVPSDVKGGETIVGSPITLTNNAPSERTISITDNSPSDISVSYVGQLTLAKKDLSTWMPTSGTQTVTYTVVGDTFKVSGVLPGYVAVYYPNTGAYDDASYTGAVVLANDVATNLPVVGDLNGGSLSDYCTNGKNYAVGKGQCVGAKLWLVPTGAVPGNVIDWSQANEFYFETSLIQFNTEGNIVMSPGSSLTITPEYTPSNYTSGTYIVTTTIA
jgi:hypothetical protein